MKINLTYHKTVSVIIFLSMLVIVNFHLYGQQGSDNINASIQDTYTMSPDSPHKPKMQYFLARLKGDHGISVIDLNGNVIAKNFTPAINSQGKVRDKNCFTPVLDDVFCVARYKDFGRVVNGSTGESTYTIYRNPSNPTPIPGLTDLFNANIVNPKFFPISKKGERIKFVDNKGNVKITVMPIDGKEPWRVSPLVQNGLIVVEVLYGGTTEEYKDDDGKIRKHIVNRTHKEGAIDTTGKWVIYPKWDRLSFELDGNLIGYNNGKKYLLNKNGKVLKEIETGSGYSFDTNHYTFEIVKEGKKNLVNVYDLNGKYVTTIDKLSEAVKTDVSQSDIFDIEENRLHSNIVLIGERYWSSGGHEDYYNLIDLKDNRIIYKTYRYLEQLPNGCYLGNNGDKCWHVKPDGSESPLPDKSHYPLSHPMMALFYDYKIPGFIVENSDGDYLCDYNGNRIGDITLEEYYNSEWEVEPVKSSYMYRLMHGEDDLIEN